MAGKGDDVQAVRWSGKALKGTSNCGTQPAATRGWCKPGGVPAAKITPEPPEERPVGLVEPAAPPGTSGGKHEWVASTVAGAAKEGGTAGPAASSLRRS